jgi:hypothetical protein
MLILRFCVALCVSSGLGINNTWRHRKILMTHATNSNYLGNIFQKNTVTEQQQQQQG